MEFQSRLMRRALARGIIDEWHIWDFSRDPGDKSWLEKEFSESHAVITAPHSKDYKSLLSGQIRQSRIQVKARNDAHLIAVTDEGLVFELIIGALNNTATLLRSFTSITEYQPDAPAKEAWNYALPWHTPQQIEIAIRDGKMIFSCLGLPGIRHEEACSSTFITRIDVHTGKGSWGWWSTQAPTENPITLIKSDVSGYEGFRSAYSHYSECSYHNSQFLKLDDDIIFFDIDQLEKMLIHACQASPSSIISANIINNGVCAHLLQKKGYLPGLEIDFEYPREGLGGSLWESGEKCTKLHEYFIDHHQDLQLRSELDQKTSILPYYDRFSINCLTFDQTVMVYMLTAYAAFPRSLDDEDVMTRIVPRFFGVKKLIYNSFFASHLSFYKQEPLIKRDQLLARYRELEAKHYGQGSAAGA